MSLWNTTDNDWDLAGGGSSGPWTAYAPVWTATITPPALGNAIVNAAYKQVGKTVHFRMDIAFGSTSTYGSGVFLFSLPVTPKDLTTNHGINVSGYCEDFAVAGHIIVSGRFYADTLTMSLFLSNGTDIGATVPFTWGSGDYIRVSGFYEAA